MKISILSNRQYKGGPATFTNRFLKFLSSESIEYTFGVSFSELYNAHLFYINLITSPKLFLFALIKRRCCVRLGAPYKNAYNLEVPYFLRLKYRLINFLMLLQALILCDRIIFQSEYSRSRWPFLKFKNYQVIYNSIPSWNVPVILNIENKAFALEHGYEIDTELDFAKSILKAFSFDSISIYGSKETAITDNILIHKSIDASSVFKLFNKPFIFILLDKNPACSNSVLEAIASFTPVIALRHPSLIELFGNEYPLFFDYVDNSFEINPLDVIRIKSILFDSFALESCFNDYYKDIVSKLSLSQGMSNYVNFIVK